MWKVRFFGIDDESYKFLTELNGDIFSRKEVRHGGGKFVEYYLHLSGYDDIEPTKILVIAEKELSVYESLLKLNRFSPNARVDHPVKEDNDGTETVYMYFTDTISITDSVDVFINDENVYSSQNAKIEDSKVILNNVLSDNVKKELLILLGSEVNWVNAYKIYEILKKHHMDEADLKKVSELKYFAHSANSPNAIGVNEARHAVQSHKSPKKIADLNLAHSSLVKLSLQFIKNNA